MEYNSIYVYLYKNGVYDTQAIVEVAKFALTQFRALCITGPRQSGKTTLSKILFKGKPYVNFEDPATQGLFENNPAKFINTYQSGAVFDEVQRVPEIFRHLQVLLDKNKASVQFILTGSNNFLLQEQVSQSLAGIAGYLTLLPLRVLSHTSSIAAQKPFSAHHSFLPVDFSEFLSPPQLRNEITPEEPFLLHNPLNQYLQVFAKTDWWPKKNLSKV